MKCRPENIFLLQKIISIVVNPSRASSVLLSPRSMRAIRLVIALLHHAMISSTPSIVYLRQGKTTSNMVRSCDTVRAGFFPQVQLQVPQKCASIVISIW